MPITSRARSCPLPANRNAQSPHVTFPASAGDKQEAMELPGLYLRHVRRWLRMTQEAFGREFGVSRRTVIRWERCDVTLLGWQVPKFRAYEEAKWQAEAEARKAGTLRRKRGVSKAALRI